MAHVIKKYKFKSDTPLEIEVVDLQQLTQKKAPFLVQPHRTNFYHIFLFESGAPAHIVDFEPIQTRPNALLFVDKDRVHQFDSEQLYKGKVLIFTDDFFSIDAADQRFLRNSILFNDLADVPFLPLDQDQFQVFLSLCNTIHQELAAPEDRVKHPLLKNLVQHFLLRAEREKRKSGYAEIKNSPDLDYTLLFRDLLEQYFTQAKNVSYYTERLHISEKRLGQATRKIRGKTPKVLIDERVLLEAKRRLVHEHQSIKELSYGLGFEEPTNFVKFFRKHTRLTPLEFREHQLKSIS
jgi:AraC-like DNA-binding protein